MVSTKRELSRLLIILFLLSIPASARAQPTVACDQDSNCGRQLTEAQKKVELGALEPALRAIQDLFDKYRDPRLLYSIARILHRLNRPAEAVPIYRRFLASSPENEPQMRAKARQQLAEAETEASVQSLQSVPTDSPPLAAEQPPANEAEVEKAKTSGHLQSEAGLAQPDAESGNTASPPRPRRGWIWGLVGGIGVAAIVVGVAVGLTISRAPPADTRDLRWISTPSP